MDAQQDEPQPVLQRCQTDVIAWVQSGADTRTRKTIDFVSERQAYMRFTAIEIDEVYLVHPVVRLGSIGSIVVCDVLQRVEGDVYQMPDEEERELVTIKRLFKDVVQTEEVSGYNPNREIHLMERYGNDRNVLRYIEALQDETSIYIVMPYCISLLDSIPGEGYPEPKAHQYFNQMLENLQYLRTHRICHRDLSPDHCMMYQGRVVFSFLGLSFQLPPNETHANGTAVRGNPAYQPPEVYLREPYYAYGRDLWAAVVSLFYMLTCETLYYQPVTNEDMMFTFFIWARGLSVDENIAISDETSAVLREVYRNQQLRQVYEHILLIQRKTSRLSQEVREIFDGVLIMNPEERCDLIPLSEMVDRWWTMLLLGE